MQRMIPILIFLAGLVFLPVAPAAAWFFGNDTLVTIDGTNYTTEDFKRWWTYWNTDNDALPQTPDSYIDWLLLSREGGRMELDEDPGFKRQTRIYLQSRGLLMLKYDAVDSRIDVTEAQIRERYEQDYTPRWLVERLVFKDEAAAAAAWQELAAGVTLEALLERDADAGGTVSRHENWVRPNEIDEGWVAILEKQRVSGVVDPEDHQEGTVLYHLKDRRAADPEDFGRFHAHIRRELWKQQEGDLTLALLRDLRKKYQVEIDQERLAAIDINAPDDSFSDAPVITTNRENVSEKQFIAVIRRLQASRPTVAHAGFDAEKANELKQETAGNIIGQSVTNWESLDRRFEEKEPFKWEYQFNYNHRLVLGVEQRLFAPEALVTDEQIEQYYRENPARYTQPEMVKLYIVDETQGPIDRFWAEVAVGKDFKQLLRNHFEQRVAPQEIPINHLDPEVKVVAERLVKGETSQIFTAQGIRVMVHLEDRTPERPLPFERVKASIRTQLWEKNLERARATYLDTLKSRTRIDVKTRQWSALRKELGGA